jgi:hypothetical protein
MKLELSVSKKNANRPSGYMGDVVFAVVDLDRAESYPLNFVCVLPKRIECGCKPSSRFLEIYGKESSQIAFRLLTKALRKESDPTVKSEIEKRLKALQPKPIIRD